MQEEATTVLLRQQRQQQEQLQHIQSFQSITGCCSATTAYNFLSRYSFNLPVALDAFYSLSQREQRILVQQHRQQGSSEGRGNPAQGTAFTVPTAAAPVSAHSGAPASGAGTAGAAVPSGRGTVSRRGRGREGAAAGVPVSTSARTNASEGAGRGRPYLRHPPEGELTGGGPAAWCSAGHCCQSGSVGLTRAQQSPTTVQCTPCHECMHQSVNRGGSAGNRSNEVRVSEAAESLVTATAPSMPGARRVLRGSGAPPPEATREKPPLQRIAETFSLYAQKPSFIEAEERGNGRPATTGHGDTPAGAGGGGGGRGRKARGEADESEEATAPTAIEIEGLERLSADLGVGLDDVFFLVFAYYCECQVQGRITREEFFLGMRRLGACTAADLQQLVSQVRQQLQQDKTLARCVYAYAFTYSLEMCQKVLPLDLCEAYWELLLQPSEYALMNYWMRFIREEHSKKTAFFSRDSWLMLFDFMQQQQHLQDGNRALPQNQQQIPPLQQQKQEAHEDRQQRDSQLEHGAETQQKEEEARQEYPPSRDEDLDWRAAAAMVEDYDEEGAWPLVIDEFVEWIRRKATEKVQLQQGHQQQPASPQ